MVQTRPGSSDPVARLVLPSRAFCLQFSPFPHSSNLLAAGLQSSITIGQCSFSEETSSGKFSWSVLQEIHHDTRVQALAWSPKSNVLASPKLVEFATSATDHKVRLFSSDLDTVSVKVLKGHTDYVNSLVFDPEAGEQLVTGSDDQTVRLWEGGECVSVLHFKSPVMSVAWHQEEVGKLLIGQKSGVICLYNAVSHQPILSLSSQLSPLLDMDWSSSNSLMVSAVGGSDLALMDMSSPSAPLISRTVHSDGPAMSAPRTASWPRLAARGTLSRCGTASPGFSSSATSSSLWAVSPGTRNCPTWLWGETEKSSCTK